MTIKYTIVFPLYSGPTIVFNTCNGNRFSLCILILLFVNAFQPLMLMNINFLSIPPPSRRGVYKRVFENRFSSRFLVNFTIRKSKNRGENY